MINVAAKILIMAIVVLINLSCSVNILESFADTRTDEALFFDATEQINKGNYSGALALINEMTPAYQARRNVKVLLASAFGGVCGLNALRLAEAMQDLTTVRLFPLLLGHFVGGSGVRIDACAAAEAILESIGTTAQRTSDENMFMVNIGLAKIGAVLSLYVDANQDGSAGTVDPCPRARGARPGAPVDGDFFEADLRELGTGLTQFLINLTALAGEVDVGSSAIAALTQACTDLNTLSPIYNFCAITDPTAFTADHLQAIVTVLNEDTALGLGSNCTGDVTVCVCP